MQFKTLYTKVFVWAILLLGDLERVAIVDLALSEQLSFELNNIYNPNFDSNKKVVILEKVIMTILLSSSAVVGSLSNI